LGATILEPPFLKSYEAGIVPIFLDLNRPSLTPKPKKKATFVAPTGSIRY
jgi:hypothetical protein